MYAAAHVGGTPGRANYVVAAGQVTFATRRGEQGLADKEVQYTD